jgi:hypothetical protein
METINAPAPYRELLKQIQNHQAAIRLLNPDQFREWSVRQSPGVDPGSATFQTLWVTLTEAGVLPRP